MTDGAYCEFDFLGFSIQQHRGKCLIKPQKSKVLAFLQTIRQWLSNHRQTTASDVIRHLNPILRGWSNYYKHAVSKRVFSYASHRLWQMLWQWCLRRHPNKGKRWVRRKYFGADARSWKFQAQSRSVDGEQTIYLFDMSSVPIERHVKVRSAASPDDSTLASYWQERSMRRTKSPHNRKVTCVPRNQVPKA